MQPNKQQREAIERERKLAADLFPARWAETLTLPGHNRRVRQKALREAAKEHVAVERVKAKGGNCHNCRNLITDPGGLKGLYCSVDSDWEGYARVPAARVCGTWQKSDAPAGRAALEEQG